MECTDLQGAADRSPRAKSARGALSLQMGCVKGVMSGWKRGEGNQLAAERRDPETWFQLPSSTYTGKKAQASFGLSIYMYRLTLLLSDLPCLECPTPHQVQQGKVSQLPLVRSSKWRPADIAALQPSLVSTGPASTLRATTP